MTAKSQARRSILSLLLVLALWSFLFHSLAMGLLLSSGALLSEAGHFLAAQLLGYKLGAPVLTPLGAWLDADSLPESPRHRAAILAAGPLVAFLTYVVLAASALWFGSVTLSGAASTLLWMNMLSLIPVPPLDGGRLCLLFSPRIAPVLGIAATICMMGYYAVEGLSGGFSADLVSAFLVLGLLCWAGMDETQRLWHSLALAPGRVLGIGQRLCWAAVYLGLLLAYIGLAPFMAFCALFLKLLTSL